MTRVIAATKNGVHEKRKLATDLNVIVINFRPFFLQPTPPHTSNIAKYEEHPLPNS
jgi:hypothetical protein